MVEKEYPGLISKQYCNPSHQTKIEFLCTKDGTLCCADCATDHSDHFEKVKDIKSKNQYSKESCSITEN